MLKNLITSHLRINTNSDNRSECILESAALWKVDAIEACSGAESGLERFA